MARARSWRAAGLQSRSSRPPATQQRQQRGDRIPGPGRRRPLLQGKLAEAAHLAGHHPPGAVVPVDLALPGKRGAEQFLHRLPRKHVRQPDLPLPARPAGHLHRHQPLPPLDRRARRKPAAETAAEQVATAAGLALPADAVGKGQRQQPPDAFGIGGRFPPGDAQLLPPVARRPRRALVAAATQQLQPVEQVAVARPVRAARRRRRSRSARRAARSAPRPGVPAAWAASSSRARRGWAGSCAMLFRRGRSAVRPRRGRRESAAANAPRPGARPAAGRARRAAARRPPPSGPAPGRAAPGRRCGSPAA